MSDCFILLSAGKSKRFKSKTNKQFITYKNKPLFEHSLKAALDSNMFKKILIVSNKKIKKFNAFSVELCLSIPPFIISTLLYFVFLIFLFVTTKILLNNFES